MDVGSEGRQGLNSGLLLQDTISVCIARSELAHGAKQDDMHVISHIPLLLVARLSIAREAC